MSSLFEIALSSNVNQILLTETGCIDRKPERYIENIKAALPGTYTLWTEDLIVDLLSNEFDKSVLDAYMTIKPLAYKADLARYCIAYARGGWYADLTVSIETTDQLHKFSDEYQGIFFRDIPMARRMSVIGNTIFWIKDSGNEIFAKVIESSVDRILRKDYSYHQHAITGPLALGEELARHQLSGRPNSLLFGDTIMIDNAPSQIFNEVGEPSYTVFSKRRAMDVDVSGVMPTGYQTSSNYWDMYLSRDVYN